MAVQIKIRRDTTANWTLANPVLADGEPGLDETLDRLKFGDGTTPWSSLPWAFAGDSSGLFEPVGLSTATHAALDDDYDAKGAAAAVQALIPNSPDDIGAEPVGLSAETKAAQALLYDAKGTAAKLPPSTTEGATFSNLRRARVIAGKTPQKGYFNALFIGDSITQGALATGSWENETPPSVFEQILIHAGMRSGGNGLTWPNNNNPENLPGNPRWVLAGFAPAAAATTGSVQSTVVGSKATFKSSRSGTNVGFFYAKANPIFRYRVDGGAWANSPAAVGGSTEWGQIIVSDLTDAKHVLEIEQMLAGTCVIGAARTYNAGMLVNNAAVSGSTTESWRSDRLWYENGPATAVIAGGVDLVLIEPMAINDNNTPAITLARHKENLLNIVTWVKNIGVIGPPSIIIWTPPRPSDSTYGMTEAEYQGFVTAHREIAASEGVTYVEVGRRFGSTYEIANTLGLMADAAHPSSAGYAEIGNALSQVLLEEGVAGTTDDTGWIDMTLSGGWLAYGEGYAPPQYRRIRGIVHVRGFIKSGTNGIFSTLPVGFRPGNHMFFAATTSTTGISTGAAVFQILSTGSCASVGFDSAYTAFSFSYPVG